jgi:hypothetical protein
VITPAKREVSPGGRKVRGTVLVGDEGLETPASPPGKPEVRILGGAESQAVLADPRDRNALLRRVVRSSRKLSAAARLAIVQIVTTMRGSRDSDSDGSPPRLRKTRFRRREQAV